MATINRWPRADRSARARGRRLAARRGATRAAIRAGIVLAAATGLAGFAWVMTEPTAAAVAATPTVTLTTGHLPRVAVPPPGSSYWLFSLAGAVADLILVLLTGALVFMYLLLRGSPTELRVARSSVSGRSIWPWRREAGGGRPGVVVARQITAARRRGSAGPGRPVHLGRISSHDLRD